MAEVALQKRDWGPDLGDDEPLPPDFHNLFVVIVCAILSIWVAKVFCQLYAAVELEALLWRSRAVNLEGMSIYANDFRMLIRQHFNHIMRACSAAPARPMERHIVAVHVRPESLKIVREGEVASMEFIVDAAVPSRLKLFWGVSSRACEMFARNLDATSQVASPPQSRRGMSAALGGIDAAPGAEARQLLAPWADGTWLHHGEEMRPFASDQYASCSRDFLLVAGLGQRLVAPASDLAAGAAAAEASMPLVIVAAACAVASGALARRDGGAAFGGDAALGRPIVDAGCQASFVRFRSGAAAAGSASPGTIPEVVQQLTFSSEGGPARVVRGIYGFEDEGDSDCTVCFARTKNVLLLPCRHCFVCQTCLRLLRDEKCPLCRSVFTAYATLPLPHEEAAGSSSLPQGDEAQARAAQGAEAV